MNGSDDDGIGRRLRRARLARGRSQREFAAEIGMPLPSYRDYEGDKRKPGFGPLRQFARSGIDPYWLLAGAGDDPPSVLGEEPGTYRAARPPDSDDRLCRDLGMALAAVERALTRLDSELAPERKATVVMVLFRLHRDTGALPSQPAVERLLRELI